VSFIPTEKWSEQNDRHHVDFNRKFSSVQKVAHTEVIAISAKDGINIPQLIVKLREITEKIAKEQMLKDSD